MYSNENDHIENSPSKPMDDDYPVIEDVDINSKTIRKLFATWRDVFGQGIEKMKSRNGGDRGVVMDSLTEAQAAVSRRLERF